MTDILAPSHLALSLATAGAAAEDAASKRVLMYAGLPLECLFVPIALETLDPVNESGINFINSIGSRISFVTGDARVKQFL